MAVRRASLLVFAALSACLFLGVSAQAADGQQDCTTLTTNLIPACGPDLAPLAKDAGVPLPANSQDVNAATDAANKVLASGKLDLVLPKFSPGANCCKAFCTFKGQGCASKPEVAQLVTSAVNISPSDLNKVTSTLSSKCSC